MCTHTCASTLLAISLNKFDNGIFSSFLSHCLALLLVNCVCTAQKVPNEKVLHRLFSSHIFNILCELSPKLPRKVIGVFQSCCRRSCDWWVRAQTGQKAVGRMSHGPGQGHREFRPQDGETHYPCSWPSVSPQVWDVTR